MANEVLVKSGTTKTWQGIGGDYGISLESVTTGAAAQGAKGDLGATRARRYAVTFKWEAGATGPTDGAVVDLYWAASTSGTAATDNPGACSGVDAAYTGHAASTVAQSALQLQRIGSLVCVEEASTVLVQQFVFEPPHRYGMPVVVNNSGQTSETNHDEHAIILTPIVDEVQ